NPLWPSRRASAVAWERPALHPCGDPRRHLLPLFSLPCPAPKRQPIARRGRALRRLLSLSSRDRLPNGIKICLYRQIGIPVEERHGRAVGGVAGGGGA